LLEVKNATEDERFTDNALVKNEPWFKFYVGIPLTTQNGLNLGFLWMFKKESLIIKL